VTFNTDVKGKLVSNSKTVALAMSPWRALWLILDLLPCGVLARAYLAYWIIWSSAKSRLKQRLELSHELSQEHPEHVTQNAMRVKSFWDGTKRMLGDIFKPEILHNCRN